MSFANVMNRLVEGKAGMSPAWYSVAIADADPASPAPALHRIRFTWCDVVGDRAARQAIMVLFGLGRFRAEIHRRVSEFVPIPYFS